MSDWDETEESGDDRIAVIGLSGRFPGAADAETFWRNLRAGTESISRFGEDELESEGVPREEYTAPDYVPAAAVLEGYDQFDAAFFGFTPREAQTLDPQQRLFLQEVYHAIEDAGYTKASMPERVGVFGGARFSDYLVRQLYGNQTFLQQVGYFQAMLSNDKDYLAPLVSYKLDLDGPSIAVQTACSTSLVAVHLACESLLSHTCNMAVAGGVTIRLPQRAGYHYQPGGIFSPTGHIRTFDAAADGTVFGNGVGVVVLKRLDEAREANDRIYGVILGSAVNNDGGRKVGLTAPAAEGQARVIADALAIAELEPQDLDYIECHGTGTNLGDAIEVAALAKVFGREGNCILGSVKTNIGHLEAAAGIAGLIKVLYMMKQRTLVPSLHFEEPNPQIGFEHTPFTVNTREQAWHKDGDEPLRAGISSFGIGGTNAHLILEEAPKTTLEPNRSQGPHLIRLAAKDEAALDRMRLQLANYLSARPLLLPADVAYTRHRHREPFDVRATVVGQTLPEIIERLESGETRQGLAGDKQPPLVYLYPGQGAQYPGMIRGLYERETIVRTHIDSGAEALQTILGRDLRELLLAEPGDERAAHELAQTQNTQPALYLVGYALSSLWSAWGITPTAMLGHSVGELVAAAQADVFSFIEGAKLVAQRGKLIASCPSGSMVGVSLGEQAIAPYLHGTLALAAVNAPELVTVSGETPAIDALCQRLEREGVEHRRLHTSHAFHSAMMDGILDDYEAVLRRMTLKPPTKPFISNVTGTWISAAEATDPTYWVRHLRGTVRFADGLRTAAEKHRPVWLEIGPGRSATTFARATVPGSIGVTSLPSPNRAGDDLHHLHEALGQLWCLGFEAAYRREEGAHISLPGYPFAEDRHWVEALSVPGAAEVKPGLPWGAAATCALPEPESADTRPAHLRASYSVPVGEVEQELAAIWEEQLGVKPVGRDDDFFDLGGHSLLATRVLARIRDRFEVELNLEAFFDGGTLAGLTRLVTEAQAGETEERPPLQPVSRSLPGVLTTAQERMWFLHQVAPESPAYNLPGTFPIEGPLDRSALDAAFDGLLARHEVLRTTFPTGRDGRPTLAILTVEKRGLPLEDLSGLPEEQQQQRLLELRREEMFAPFRLERDLLLRGRLVRLAEEHHVILLTLHHIVADGGSFGLLARDFRALYDANVACKPSPLPALPVQYADYAHWQQRVLDGERLAALDTYWRNKLEGAPLVFDLDTDYPRPPITDHRGARLAFQLDPKTSEALRALARNRGGTMFMTLLTLFQVMLWNRSGSRDFLIGTHLTHRSHRDLENLVGLFVNQLVLRAELHDHRGYPPSFAQLLNRTRETVLQAFAHQRMPFERLVELLKPDRDLSRNPVIQVLFVYQNHPPTDSGEDGNLPVAETGEDLAVRDDLRLELFESSGSIEGYLEYRTSLFKRETIQYLADQFAALAKLVIYDPHLQLPELGIRLPHLNEATVAAQHKLLSRASLPLGPLIYQRWLAGADRWPQHLAVVSEEEPHLPLRHLTYARLHEIALKLAVHLGRIGVGPEKSVALFCERSSAFVIGLLGISAAGGAFVPLDVRSPGRRLLYQVQRAQADVIVTLDHWRHRLPGAVLEGRTIICLEELEQVTVPRNYTLPEVAPNQTAYILFTSGSTGEPKGVAVEHQQLAYYVDAMIERLELTPQAYAWVLATTADAGHTALFPTLSIGGTLHAVDHDVAAQPEALATYLERHKIQDMKVMPSLLQSLQVGGHTADVLPPRHLVMTGEPAELSWIEALRKARPGMRIDNEYGPTETTVGVTVARFDTYDLSNVDTWPIGTALAGVRCYLVDGLDRPVAPMMRGELHIGGDLVTRCYVDQPALTAQRFIPDPWSPTPGGRRYCTGDYARLDHHGELFFHGRIDAQVKVRGFRVEIGEIESQLRAGSLVDHCAVRLVKDPSPRLVAYVVPSPEARERYEEVPLKDALRQQLAERVPPSMVPTGWVILQALPLLSNGKLNARALPKPPSEEGAPERPPKTAIERQLAAVWCQVLRRERVGLDDHFFQLGGDSLLSIQVIALANRAGLPLTPQLLFRYQTLGEQAAVLEKVQADQKPRAAVMLQGSGEKTPVFCIHSAGGMVFGYIELARAMGTAAPFYGIQDLTYTHEGLNHYDITVEQLADRYLTELLEIQPRGPFRLMGHSFGGLVAFELAKRLTRMNRQVEQLALLDTTLPGTERPGDDPQLDTLCHILRVMFRMQGRENPVPREELATLIPAVRMERASSALRQLQGTDELTPQRLHSLITVFAAHDRAAANYTSGPLQLPLQLVRPQADLTAAREKSAGWYNWTTREVKVSGVPGDHTTMLMRANARALADVLN